MDLYNMKVTTDVRCMLCRLRWHLAVSIDGVVENNIYCVNKVIRFILNLPACVNC